MDGKSLFDMAALLHARDWEAAHVIAQDSTEPLAAWAHGIVHLIEGDESNARYWYGQAGRTFPGMHAIDAEIIALDEGLKKREGNPHDHDGNCQEAGGTLQAG